ncbi:MAG: DEAD/DEAH box helicase family protein [bacterium]
MSLESIKFSYPESIPTRTGVKFVRKWKIPNGDVGKSFWFFWKQNKTKMLGKGFTVAKNVRGEWELQDWKDKISDFKDYTPKPEIVMESSLQLERLKDSSGLRDFQVPAVERLVASIRTHGAALDGSSTGTGKTYIAIGVARELGAKVGVICPKSVIESWKRVITNHFKLDYEFVLNYESLKGQSNNHIVSKVRKERSFEENFVWHIPKNTLLIFDESHRLKGNGTLNVELAVAAKKQRYDILCCSATNAIDPLELNCVGYISWTS